MLSCRGQLQIYNLYPLSWISVDGNADIPSYTAGPTPTEVAPSVLLRVNLGCHTCIIAPHTPKRSRQSKTNNSGIIICKRKTCGSLQFYYSSVATWSLCIRILRVKQTINHKVKCLDENSTQWITCFY